MIALIGILMLQTATILILVVHMLRFHDKK